MKDLFLEVVKLSLAGSVFVAAVVLLRLVFRKAPRWVFCLLWAMAAMRLVLPLHIETEISLMPPVIIEGQAVEGAMSGFVGDTTVFYEGSADFSAAVDAGREPVVSPEGNFVVTQTGSLEAPVTVGDVLAWVWLAGVVLMLGYAFVSWYLLRRRVSTAVRRQGNVWESELVDSPFVLGLLRPRIYLPFHLDPSDRENVIAHEKAHLLRGDHWWKPLGFLLLSVYWFNPVMWAAYVLLCRDIEGACDEKVIGSMTKDQMRAYSRALLNCSVHRKRIAACPLAFGEIGTKQRIKTVMHYKKPAFWIVVTAVAASVLAAVLLLTDPAKEEKPRETTAPVETTQPISTDPVVTLPYSGTEWDGTLLGASQVFYEILDARKDPSDPQVQIGTYRFFCIGADGMARELLAVEQVDRVLSGDYDGDGVVELFVQVRQNGKAYRLYDLVDGQIRYTEPELVPDGMLSYEVLLNSGPLYLYKEQWIRFFRETETYLLELAKLERTQFYYGKPTGSLPSEISEQQFREGYLAIQDFLDQERTEQQRWAAFMMLLELDQNCTPETAVELTGSNPYKRLFDKRRYTQENSGQWRNCMEQLGVLFDREPGALMQAMAARKENWDAEIGWLVSTRFYYDSKSLSGQLKQMENDAVTDEEKALAKAFRDSYETMKPPLMDVQTLLSGTGEQLWNAFIMDTEAVIRCFGQADKTQRYQMRNLLWSAYGRPEKKSLEKCYDAVNRLLGSELSKNERDVAYMFLVLVELQGGFRDKYVPGEAFDYQRLFDKHLYTDGASSEYWSIQSVDVFRQDPLGYLQALREWDDGQGRTESVLLGLAYGFYGEDALWLRDTLKTLGETATDSGILEMITQLEEMQQNVS